MPAPRKYLLVAILATLSLGGLICPAHAVEWKSDPGMPDSLWIPDVLWRGDTLFALSVYSATDDSLGVAQITLAWPNPALKVDSVKFNVGRWNVTGYPRWTSLEGGTAVAIAFLPTGKRLPPGSGLVAKIWCGRDSAYTFDTDFAVDTGHIVPMPPLAAYRTVFSDLPGEPFLPTYISTPTITFNPCICPNHGDLVQDGAVDAIDLSYMIDGVFFGGATPLKDPQCSHIHAGDYNMDGFYDAIDLSLLIDHVFFGGSPAVPPCREP